MMVIYDIITFYFEIIFDILQHDRMLIFFFFLLHLYFHTCQHDSSLTIIALINFDYDCVSFIYYVNLKFILITRHNFI